MRRALGFGALVAVALSVLACGDDGGGSGGGNPGSGGASGTGTGTGTGPGTGTDTTTGPTTGTGGNGTGGSGGSGTGGEAPLELESVRSDVPYDSSPDATEAELLAVRMSSLDLAAGLTVALRGEHDNVLLSPHSLSSAFGQLYAGTRGELHDSVAQAMGWTLGDRIHPTLNAIDVALLAKGFAGTEEHPPLEIARANALFTDEAYADQVEPGFLDLLSEHYDSGLYLVPLLDDVDLAVGEVNEWVADRTHDRIVDLIPRQEPGVTMILVNSLYFQASWDTAFDEASTTQMDFTRASGDTVSVDMMHAIQVQGRYAEVEGWQAASLPFDDGRLEMVFLLPEANRREELESALSAEVLGSVLDGLEPAALEISVPKLNLSPGTIGLREPLIARGLLPSGEMAFPGDEIAGVYHQVFLAMHEKGTEAAAATGIVVSVSGATVGGDEHELTVDRTFHFVLQDLETGDILFFGRVDQPS